MRAYQDLISAYKRNNLRIANRFPTLFDAFLQEAAPALAVLDEAGVDAKVLTTHDSMRGHHVGILVTTDTGPFMIKRSFHDAHNRVLEAGTLQPVTSQAALLEYVAQKLEPAGHK